MAGAITGGHVTVAGADWTHLENVLRELEAAGFQLDTDPGGVSLRVGGPSRPRDIVARPYPGTPTDIQAQWTALLALASGRSRVADTVFPQRFQHVAELRRLGAEVRMDGASALVCGVCSLEGATVRATDLRAGAALVLAGLAAQGETIVTGLDHLDRGYEALDRKLAQLGARISRAENASATVPVSAADTSRLGAWPRHAARG
jgi:UDP-N-acetylglucosamine 1-carboxyvinyltransferase